MTHAQFEAELDRLAEVAVKVGLRLEKGQDLLMTSPVAALPLARRITAEAYKAGAGLVTCLLSDEEMSLARYQYGADFGFDRAADWLYAGMGEAFSKNTARLAIAGDNPMLLSEQDPDKVGRANKAMAKAYSPAREKITGFDINWSIVSYPNPSWAKVMFPDDPEEIAVAKLAHAVFAASRVDLDDPVAAWKAHNGELRKRSSLAERDEFLGAPLHWPRHGPDHRTGGRA